MGFLDTNFAKLVFSGSPYMQSREAERIKAKEQEQMQGILSQYRSPQPLGGQPQGNGLLSSTLPAQAFQDLAVIRPQLFNQLSANQGAMNRQQQEQEYGAENMSAYQREMVDQQQQQRDLAMDRYNDERNAAFVNAVQQPQTAMPTAPAGTYNVMDQQTGGLLGQAPLPGSKQYQTQVGELDALQSGIDSAIAMENRIKKYGAYESGAESRQANRQHRDNIMASLQAANKSGTMDQSEYKRLMEQLPSQEDWGNIFKSDDKAAAAYTGVMERLQAVYDAANKKYAIPGQQTFR